MMALPTLLSDVQMITMRVVHGSLWTAFSRKHLCTAPEDSLKYMRNVGIIAHIDAGKTTTTERMLFNSGRSQYLGSVDSGDTVTDYMSQERERGITITSAAVSMMWKKHTINLIDTPGHVDFAYEVDRSLRVLDGAIVVLDAASGVEAQTITVWNQSKKFENPSVVFVNKIDKKGANFESCLASIEEKLGVTPLPVQVPDDYEQSRSLVDVINMRRISWKGSKQGEFQQKHLQETDEIWQSALSARLQLVEQLADFDDCIAEIVLSDRGLETVDSSKIVTALRLATLSGKFVPVLCGASLRNVGVQQLMDSIAFYLPSPDDRATGNERFYAESLCALAFKVIHDKQRGPVTMVRIYSGTLKSGSQLYNVSNQMAEKPSRVLSVLADDLRDIQRADRGEIVAITGLKHTSTGDTLTTTCNCANKARKRFLVGSNQKDKADDETEEDYPVLASMDAPSPVFFCSVEAGSPTEERALDIALNRLMKEDPSIHVESSEETGQTVISGQGELHLEVILQRLREEYGLDASTSELQIAYRETVLTRGEATYRLERTLFNQDHWVELSAEVEECDSTPQKLYIAASSDGTALKIPRRLRKPLDQGLQAALRHGPLCASIMLNMRATLTQFTTSPRVPTPLVTAAVNNCIQYAAKEANPQLLEPVMDIQVTTPPELVSTVLGDLSRRRAQVEAVQESGLHQSTVRCICPLSELLGYTSILRTLTSGRANVLMQLHGYQPVDVHTQQSIIEKRRSWGLCSEH